MSAGIPEHLDVRRLARQGAQFQGRLKVAEMPRLAALVEDADTEVAVALEISRDRAGNDIVAGEARAVLALRCQRCLEPAALEVDAAFSLQCVADADTECADAAYEPLVVPEEGIAASALIEDEMILALPAIAMHADISECGNVAQMTEAGDDAVEEEEKDNPFAVLRKLKQDR